MRWISLLLVVMACVTGSLASSNEHHAELESLPETKNVNGTELTRQGAGIRSLSMWGLSINVYTAGFYTLAPLRDWEAVQECNAPKHMEFTFLKSVNRGQVKQAWQRQLKASVTHLYDGYDEDREVFIRMFGPITSGGTLQIQLLGEDTVVVDQGEHKGIVRGRNFQRSFLSMFFGEKAIQASLKAGLLGHTVKEAATAVC